MIRDLRHWEVTMGRLSVHRWCKGAPCHLLPRPGRHPIGVRLWRRTGSARFDT